MSYFKAKVHEIRFRRGLYPDPAAGAYSAPQTLWLDLRDPTTMGRSGVEGKGGEGREREGMSLSAAPIL